MPAAPITICGKGAFDGLVHWSGKVWKSVVSFS